MRGIGIDIVEIERFETRLEKPAFLKLVFTDAERKNCASKGRRAECFAARFAAKEAYMKAVGLGWSANAEFLEIEITSNELGQPSILLHGKSLDFFVKNGYQSTFLSISHTSKTAVAVVILQ